MFYTRLAISIVICSILIPNCLCAPKVVRNDFGRQVDFPDSETIPETDVQPRGFLQIIFDMVKRWFGFDNKTTIVREDGTIEEVDSNESFLARFGKKILGLVSSILKMITGGGDISSLDLSFPRSLRSNEIENKLLKMRNQS